jgi:hypothetical protein
MAIRADDPLVLVRSRAMGGKVAIALGLVAGAVVGGLLVGGAVALAPGPALPPASSSSSSPAPTADPTIALNPTAVPAAEISPGPATAFASDGPFQLELELPRTTFSTAEPVTGQGILSTIDGSDVAVAGSGSGLITFSYSEIGGRRSMGGEATADCRPYTIAADDPMTEQLTHSASWSSDDPDAAFYEAFAQGPDVRLPPGAWQVTARATFLGADCTMPEHDMRASTVIVVTP